MDESTSTASLEAGQEGRLRMSLAVGLEFLEQDGVVSSYVARGPGGQSTFHRFEVADSEER